MGPLTNPPYVQPSQSVEYVFGQSNGVMAITGDRYSPGPLTKVALTQTSDKVGAENEYTL